VNRACETVFVEAVAQMRAAEPCVTYALKGLHLRLRGNGRAIEYRMIEFMGIEQQLL
jgi:hypothetical protein